jgi:hypothetical protein
MSNVKVFLDPSGPCTCSIVGSLNASVYGTDGLNDKVKLGINSTADCDGNIDQVFLPLAANAYTFHVVGNSLRLKVGNDSKFRFNGTFSPTDSRKLIFANGSVLYTRNGINAFIGGVAVPVGESAASTLAFTLDTSETYATAGF